MRPAIFTYTTPEAVILQLDKANPNVALPNPNQAQYNDLFANVYSYCKSASAYITTVTGRLFVPYRDDRAYYHEDLAETGAYINGRMALGEDLFVLNSIDWNGTTLSTTDYRLMPINALPYDALRLNGGSNLAFTPGDFEAVTTVSGWWGYHTNVSDAYTTLSTSITLANGTATSVTVTDSSLYKTLEYVKCESELMQITALVDATTLTVTRGMNGTTAAAHTAQPLARFNVVPDVALAATRMVAYFYQRRNDVGAAIMLPDNSVNWGTMPHIIEDIVEKYTRRVWGSVTSPR